MVESGIRGVTAFTVLVGVCAGLLAGTWTLTAERITDNRAQRFTATVAELAGASAGEVVWRGDTAALCHGRTLLRGSAPGYGGTIRWLAAAATGGGPPRLSGVRITAHQETPGIADFLDEPAHGWLAALAGRDAAAVSAVATVTGATITSRGLRRSLASALEDLPGEPGDAAPPVGPCPP